MLIDTHKAVRDLAEVGVPEEQAERIVDVVSRADDKVVTKDDLEKAELRIVLKTAGLTTGLLAALLAIFEFLI